MTQKRLLAKTLRAEIAAQYCNPNALRGQARPARVDSALDDQTCSRARAAITSWSNYAPTPLHSLPALAHEIGIGQLLYKDESTRFGLGSFKALGGAYAVLHSVAQEISVRGSTATDIKALMTGQLSEAAGEITVATATDGNHGRSVAWGAGNVGCKCVIYMHAEVSPGRQSAVEAFGAEVVRVPGDYGESARQAAQDAAANGWLLVSDTAWPGYTEIPRAVMAGYTVMSTEAMDQLPATTPTHVFVQGGCGGLAGAVCTDLWHRYESQRPRFVVVEPVPADCLFQSAVAGAVVNISVTRESVMGGLSCGEVSLLGWDILESGADHFLTIEDDAVGPLMKQLAQGRGDDPRIVAGEAAVAGLAGCIAARADADLCQTLALNEQSTVLVFGTEGATDPTVYRQLVGSAADDLL
ncbi:MAG: diaminopropionate ammonia-lyase [Arenicellales bacterium]|nr:diaminopropionate ammonia-lyase [Arenicellales bacterium]MDP6411386.1 diaminopropionate ammonia-lyase [Arenicellales bacterium]|tara:strand:- start:1172 stop:2407 length:1236 start_codon:yes stop_codon:yes gene_type:complete